MTAPRSAQPDSAAAARELLDEILEGARANERPDLVRRIIAARAALAATPGPTTVRQAADAALHSLDSLEVDLRSRRATLGDPDRAARLWAELRGTAQAVEDLRDRLATWGQVLSEGFTSLQSDVEFRLLTGLRAVAADSDRVVADTGRRDSGELDAWLTQRVAVEAAEVRALLGAGAGSIAIGVGEHLRLARTPAVPRIPEPVLPHLQASARAAALPVPHRRAARLLTVGMPTYGGLMMGFILPRVLDLVLPQHLMVAIAVLAACAMGGSALAVERHQRRDLWRNNLRMAARGAVDDASVALGKEVRDALRDVQRQLRDSLTAGATARAGEFEQAHRTAAAAAEAARNAPAAIADIDADLGELARLRTQAHAIGRPPAPGHPAPAATRLLAVVADRSAG